MGCRIDVGVGLVAMLLLVGASGSASKTHTAGQELQGLVLSETTGALPAARPANVRIFQSTFPPGFKSSWHTHPSPPFVYVISGTATWEYRDGSPPVTRHAGEAVMEPPNAILRLVNRQKTSMHLVLFQVSKIHDPVMRLAHTRDRD